MLALGEEAKKVGVGLMCRHCKARGNCSTHQNGEIGDVFMPTLPHAGTDRLRLLRSCRRMRTS
jgi:hypothetical protein